MQNKPTDDLQNELMSEPSFDSYMNENRPFFSQQSVAELLTALYEQQDISKAALARKAGMSEVYLHQVFAGRRNPSRDRLLCLCGIGRHIGGDAAAFEAGVLCPAVSQDQAGCHHQLWNRPSHVFGRDQRPPVFRK